AALSVLLAAILCPPARAAFELRDAGPLALGAASPDGASIPSGPWSALADRADSSEPDVALSWRAGGSRASLFDVEGLEQGQLDLDVGVHRVRFRVDYMAVQGPGSRESSARLTVGERTARAVSLTLAAERLDASAEDGPRLGGWALGARARSRLGSRIEAWIAGERLLRTRELALAGVAGSVELGAAVHAHGSALTVLDRMEPDQSHSPRVVLDIPLGSAASVRLGRGSAPGRIGASFTVRI